MRHFDLALIGFGAATMSLAVRLAPRYAGRIAIIEPRRLPTDDRTWCGWRLDHHPFVDRATQVWTSWAVSQGDHEVVRSSAQTPYEMLRASSVQQQALEAVKTRPDWNLFTESALQTAQRRGSAWSLTLDSGETVTATRVMDSRPPSVALERPWVWQSFVGRELRGPGLAGDLPVRLMDFTDDRAPLLTFVYELPIGPDHRLIELTRFAPQRPDLSMMNEDLDRLLARRGLADHTVVREEASHLPMAPIPASNRADWMRVGTAGGSMRPATGYAFHGIQRWADTCAEALIAGDTPPAPSRRPLMDWLDGVFLESLWRHQPSGTAGTPFVSLFERAPPEAMTRFLMSRPRPADIGHILRALPPIPMLKAALQYSCRRRQGVRIDPLTG